MNKLEPWLARYEWYTTLPHNWKEAVQLIAKEVSAESFVGMTDIHEALAHLDDNVIELLHKRGDVRKDVVDLVEKIIT